MKFDTLDEWLDWQENLHVQSIDLGLDRIRPVYNKLLNKPLAKKVILVGGTNGKGSTTAFLESIYVAAGYQVGTYTSPHLFKYNERIRLNGDMVDDQTICQAFQRVENAREEVSLTYFEFGTLAAFEVFQQAQLDVAILEIGLGGRLDAVNLSDADVAIITNINLDHTNWLGETREQIAFEKFGIARPNKPLIFADDDPPINVDELCIDSGCELIQIGKDFGFTQKQSDWQWWGNNKKMYSLPFPALHGFHQLKNASCALMAIHDLSHELPVSMAHIRVGLSKVTLPGRFQVIADGTKFYIFDVAHNPHGVNAFIQQLKKMPHLGNHRLILGMLADKNVRQVMQALSELVDVWYLASLAGPRGLSAGALQETLESIESENKNLYHFDSVKSAFIQARQDMRDNDKLIVIGSFYTVAEAMMEFDLLANH